MFYYNSCNLHYVYRLLFHCRIGLYTLYSPFQDYINAIMKKVIAKSRARYASKWKCRFV